MVSFNSGRPLCPVLIDQLLNHLTCLASDSGRCQNETKSIVSADKLIVGQFLPSCWVVHLDSNVAVRSALFMARTLLCLDIESKPMLGCCQLRQRKGSMTISVQAVRQAVSFLAMTPDEQAASVRRDRNAPRSMPDSEVDLWVRTLVAAAENTVAEAKVAVEELRRILG